MLASALRAAKWRVKLAVLAHRASLAETRGVSPAGYLANIATGYRLYSRHGFLPDEAGRLGLLSAPAEVERRYVSKSRLVARQRVLNHPSFQDLTEDKALFYAFCTRAGLPVPRLYGIFFRNASGLKWPQEPLADSAAWASFFEQDCPTEFVVKPSRGVYGEGIVFGDRRLPGFSGAALVGELQNDRRYDSFVVQDCLQNHPELLALSPARGLQTTRVITFVGPDGAADVLMAYLKPIGGLNRVDNHNSGRTGNFLCRIDVQTGVLGDLKIVGAAGVQTLPAHPQTGRRFEGQQMPLWADVAALARRLAVAFLPMRAVGWDIAVTPAGAVCIEGNARWDPPKFGDVSALRPVLERH